MVQPRPTAARAAVLVLLLASAPAPALEFEPRAELEGRWFHNVPPEGDPGARPEGGEVTGSVAATVELFHEFGGDRNRRLVGELFGRIDADDHERSHGDVRELFLHWIERDYEVRVGNRRVFWGVTESHHLVDIINQSDFVEDVDAESKLGQPMANLAWITGVGTLDLFWMPYQRERTFPGDEGRPRLPFPVHEDEARWESDREKHHQDVAARFVSYLGPVDLGLAYFNGTARNPRLVPCLRRGSGYAGTETQANCAVEEAVTPEGSPLPDEVIAILVGSGAVPPPVTEADIAAIFANLVLVPHYDRLEQVSLDVQYVIESLALKLEALAREELGVRTAAAVAGFEYTFGDVAGSGWDIGVLGEYLSDEKRDLLNRTDDEVFAGTRIALNDVAGTTLLAGGLAERKGFRNRAWLVEASRRLGDDWKLSVEARVFTHTAGRGSDFLEDQDYTTVVLERFF